MRAKDGDEEGEGQIRRRIGILDMPDEIFFAIFDSLPPSCPWLFAIAIVCRRFASVMKAYNLGPVNTPPRFYLSDPETLSLACRSGLDLDTMDPAEIGRAVRGMSSGRAEMLEYLWLDEAYEMLSAELVKFSDADWRRFCQLGYDWIFRDTWNLRQKEYYKPGNQKTIPDTDPVCCREDACPYHCFRERPKTSDYEAITLRLKGYQWPANPRVLIGCSPDVLAYALGTGASPSSLYYLEKTFRRNPNDINRADALGLPKTAFASIVVADDTHDIDLLEYMHSRDYPMHADLCNFFVYHYYNHPIRNTIEFTKDCIRRLLDMGVEKPETVYLISSRRGPRDIDLLEWLAANGFPLPANLAFLMAKEGHTDGVVFALRHGCTKHADLTIVAITHGTPQMLRSLLSHGVPLHPDFGEVCRAKNAWECLNEARLHGLPWQAPDYESFRNEDGFFTSPSKEMREYLENNKDAPLPITPNATVRRVNRFTVVDFRVRDHFVGLRDWTPTRSIDQEAADEVKREFLMGGLPGRVGRDPEQWDDYDPEEPEWARIRLIKHLRRWFPEETVLMYLEEVFPEVAYDIGITHEDGEYCRDTYTRLYAESWDAPESRRNDPVYPSLGREYRNGRQRHMEERSRRMLGGAAE